MSGRTTQVFYGGSAIAVSFAQLIAGFFTVKWLAPEDLGLWQSARLSQVYAFVLLFGIINGLSRELPYFLGRNDTAFCKRLAGSALFVTNAATSVVLITAIGLLYSYRDGAPSLLYTIIALALLIPLSFYQNLLLVAYRSNDSFITLSKIQCIEAGLSLATIPLLYYFGFEGMLARTVLVSSLIVLIMYRQRPFHAESHFNLQSFHLLFKTGAPIFALDYFKNLSGTIDRVLILQIVGVAGVGHYALAIMTFQMLQVIPKSLGQYTYPRMSYEFGRSGNTSNLWPIGLRSFIFSTTLTGTAASVSWFLIPPTVQLLAPDYHPGIRAAQILLIAGVFEGSIIIANILWSIKAWKLMTIYQLTSAILSAAGPFLAATLIANTLEAIAWGVVAGSATRCFLAVCMTYFATRKGLQSENMVPQNEKSSETFVSN